MKILAVESSAGPASCAVYEDGKVLASSYINVKLKHSQTLLPMIDAMLKNSGVGIDDIDMLAVAAGPGSFTGIRIGVAAVKGIAFARGIPCVGVSTLAAMAHMAAAFNFDGIVCPAMDARCTQVYTAMFECRGKTITRLTEDSALMIEELKNQIISTKKSVLFIGDGALLCYNAICQHCSNVYIAPEPFRFQNAVGVAMQAANEPEKAVSADRLVPIYLRLPQAERELKRKMGAKA